MACQLFAPTASAFQQATADLDCDLLVLGARPGMAIVQLSALLTWGLKLFWLGAQPWAAYA
jgi:hypothetical protein